MRGGANHLNASIGKLINAGQFSPSVCSVHFSRVFQMSSLEWWLAAVTNRAANLTRQLRELCKLRDRVRQAELSTRKCGNPRRRSGMKPRSRIRRAPGLFREAKPALLALGISDSRTGGLIVQWLKLTNDDGPACAGLPGVVQGLSGEGAGGFDPAPQISAHRAVKG